MAGQLGEHLSETRTGGGQADHILPVLLLKEDLLQELRGEVSQTGHAAAVNTSKSVRRLKTAD